MAEGVTDSEFARFINQRSMLTVSNCISTGHSAVVFPEGTSHQDSLLHGFKTGPFRTVFAASALQKFVIYLYHISNQRDCIGETIPGLEPTITLSTWTRYRYQIPTTKKRPGN